MLKRIFNLSQNSCFYRDSLQLPFIKQSITTPSLFAFNSGNGTECLCGYWKWRFSSFGSTDSKISILIIVEGCAHRWFPNWLELIDLIYQGSYASLEWFIVKAFTHSNCDVAAITKLFIFYFGVLYGRFTNSISTVSYFRVKAARSSQAGSVAFLCLKTWRGKSSLNTNLLIPKWIVYFKQCWEMFCSSALCRLLQLI